MPQNQNIANLLKIPNKKIVHVKDRPGHDTRYALDASKLKKLGFNPKYSFAKGLQETVAWYKENIKWWRKIKQSKDFKNYYNKQYLSNAK